MTQLPKDEELHRIEAAREQAQREMFASIERQRTEQAEAQADGIPALMRLVEIAHLRGAGDTSQNHHVRRFLLGLYNGSRWPFDMTRLSSIERDRPGANDHPPVKDWNERLKVEIEREQARAFDLGM